LYIYIKYKYSGSVPHNAYISQQSSNISIGVDTSVSNILEAENLSVTPVRRPLQSAWSDRVNHALDSAQTFGEDTGTGKRRKMVVTYKGDDVMDVVSPVKVKPFDLQRSYDAANLIKRAYKAKRNRLRNSL